MPPPPGSTYRVSAGNRMSASVNSASPGGLRRGKGSVVTAQKICSHSTEDPVDPQGLRGGSAVITQRIRGETNVLRRQRNEMEQKLTPNY